MSTLRLTKPQTQAVTAPRGNLLVAAAAGSGKTAVLSQRVLRHLTEEPMIPANRLLIVTFTVAASVEMRTRIEARLSEKLEADPQNPLLLRQQLLLSQAQISTIHSFCAALIRDQFQQLGIPRDHHVGEEAEIKTLEEEVLAAYLEERYASGEEGFLALSRRFTKKNDLALERLLLDTYHFVRGLPFPKNRLREFLKPYETDTPFGQTRYGALLREELLPRLRQAKSLLQIAETRALTDGKIAKAYGGALHEDLLFASLLLEAVEAGEWDRACGIAQKHTKPRLSPVRGYDPASFLEGIKELRAEAYGILEDLKTRLFSIPEAADLEDRKAQLPLLQTLAAETSSFLDRMRAEKNARSLLDFNDLEQLSLELLVHETETGYEKTAIAREMAGRYDEIMVDECQDINRLQNLLFWAVSKGPDHASKTHLVSENLFMVGDLKQSIYRFRGSAPELFAARRREFPLYTDPGVPGGEAQIALSHNFRSRVEVADAVNDLFSRLFSQNLGGLDYGEGEALVPAAAYLPHPNATAELHLLEQEEELGDRTEPVYVAKLIRRMVEEGFPVEGHGVLRPCRWRDFCILLRAKKGKTERYLEALRQEKINCYAESTTGYFDSEEISLLLNLLRVLDNPLLDIPLFSVLISPLFGFTPDDLVRVRLAAPGEALYFGVVALAKEDARFSSFLDQLSQLRQQASVRSVEETIRLIFESTAFLSLMGAMVSGEQRRANLLLLLQYAKNYDTIGGQHLEGFLRYVDRAIARGEDFSAANVVSEQADVVRVMSIHGSKGLEFPVVIVADLAKTFNQMDLNASVLFHGEEGIALKMRRPERLQHYSTLPQETLRLLQKRELFSEELRILYVAMTRAKEKLLLVGTAKKMGDFSKDLVPRAALARETGWESFLLGQNSYLKWICAALADTRAYREAVQSELLGGREAPFRVLLPQSAEEPDAAEPARFFTAQPQAGLRRTLERQLSFRYENSPLTTLPAKLSVTQLTKSDREAHYEALPKLELRASHTYTGAERGTILHHFMQYADFTRALADLEGEITRLVDHHLLSPEESKVLNRRKIRAFLDSDLFARMRQAAAIHREFAFFQELDVTVLDPTLSPGPKILVQGIADMILEESDRLVLVDYKTDWVETPGELLARYSGQIALYRRALAAYFQKPVAEAYLYSLHLEQAIPVPESIE